MEHKQYRVLTAKLSHLKFWLPEPIARGNVRNGERWRSPASTTWQTTRMFGRDSADCLCRSIVLTSAWAVSIWVGVAMVAGTKPIWQLVLQQE